MKARFFAIAALVLGLASCQKDFAPEMNSGDEVKVTLSVSAPELIGATRAGVNGEVDENKALDSRFGAIDYLDGNVAGDNRWDWNDVDIRYTMEVYDQDDLSNPIKDRQEIIEDQYKKVEFEVRLIPNRKYQFVVFADFVDQETKKPLRHVLGKTLNDITLVNEAILDEVADCYFKSWEFEPTNNTQNRTEATLTRPYAKVRVIATDLAELNLNVHPETIEVEYNTVIPTTFNAVKGTIDGDNTTKTFTYDYIAKIRDNMADHVYNADYDAMRDKGRASHMTLFTDYILAEDEQDAINFKMTVKDKKGAIKVVDFNTEIPVQRNYLTTIIGDVLTTNVNVEVNISDNFANNVEDAPYYIEIWDGKTKKEPKYDAELSTYSVARASELAWVAEQVNGGNTFAGQTIELTAPIELNSEYWTPIGTAENVFNGTFDGNNYVVSNLKVESEGHGAMFAYVGANTVIKNFNLENVDIKAKYAAGVLAEANDAVVVENITVSGNVYGKGYAAGVVCFNSYSADPAITIKNCTNNATVTSQRAGGIGAWITGNSNIKNVVNNGDISGTISAAGITNRIAGTIKNAVNYGTIVGNDTEASAGIAGTATAATTFEYCYNYGNVTTTMDNANSSAAGILGQAASKDAIFNYCANFGEIVAEQSYAAGIGYSLYGTITANYCYNAGAVNGADGAGAIAPKAQYGANDTAKYCLNAGEITSAKKVYQGSNKNTSCFYYNNGVLLNVADNAVVAVDAALAVLNGGADAQFFANENGVIVVK